MRRVGRLADFRRLAPHRLGKPLELAAHLLRSLRVAGLPLHLLPQAVHLLGQRFHPALGGVVFREHRLDALPRLQHPLELLLADDPHGHHRAFRPLRPGRVVVFDAAEELDRRRPAPSRSDPAAGGPARRAAATDAAAAADRTAAGGNRSGCETVAAAKSRSRPRPKASPATPRWAWPATSSAAG